MAWACRALPGQAPLAEQGLPSLAEKACRQVGQGVGPPPPDKYTNWLDEQDFVHLHEHGFSDEDIWDIAAITAFFGLSNRMVNFASIQPNVEFYNMARSWD